MKRISLPKELGLDAVETVSAALWKAASDVELVLAPDQWAEPEGLAALACLISLHREQGHRVNIDWSACPERASWWERMGFFDLLSLPGPRISMASGPRRSRFSELCLVCDTEHVDTATAAILDALDLQDDAREVADHIVSEALNNIAQHSMAAGFGIAHQYDRRGTVKLCIADYGIGFRESLRARNPESDVEAIRMALEPGVTGAPPKPRQDPMRNRGVGLTMIRELLRLNGGSLVLWSGSGALDITADKTVPRRTLVPWQGVLMVASLPQRAVRSLQEVARLVRDQLKQSGGASRRWTRMP